MKNRPAEAFRSVDPGDPLLIRARYDDTEKGKERGLLQHYLQLYNRVVKNEIKDDFPALYMSVTRN
jgi:hypothetical protein